MYIQILSIQQSEWEKKEKKRKILNYKHTCLAAILTHDAHKDVPEDEGANDDPQNDIEGSKDGTWGGGGQVIVHI